MTTPQSTASLKESKEKFATAQTELDWKQKALLRILIGALKEHTADSLKAIFTTLALNEGSPIPDKDLTEKLLKIMEGLSGAESARTIKPVEEKPALSTKMRDYLQANGLNFHGPCHTTFAALQITDPAAQKEAWQYLVNAAERRPSAGGLGK